MSILEFENLSYYYDNNKTILNDVNYKFEKGNFYALVGRSGCGKTTTLSLMGALEKPKKGRILFGGEDIKKIGYDNYRRKNISIIFQSYNLIPYMSAVQNVVTGMEISNSKVKNKKQRALELLNDVGISQEEAVRNVLRLSGGQQQRVAIARALACDVNLILADEPTGNLDENTTKEIINIFKNLAKEDKCVIMVTHSKYVANEVDHVLAIDNGCINHYDKSQL